MEKSFHERKCAAAQGDTANWQQAIPRLTERGTRTLSYVKVLRLKHLRTYESRVSARLGTPAKSGRSSLRSSLTLLALQLTCSGRLAPHLRTPPRELLAIGVSAFFPTSFLCQVCAVYHRRTHVVRRLMEQGLKPSAKTSLFTPNRVDYYRVRAFALGCGLRVFRALVRSCLSGVPQRASIADLHLYASF